MDITFNETISPTAVKTHTKVNIIWADACRVMAIFGIILIHTSAGFFYQYETLSTFGWASAALLDALARAAVPIFIMLSGALLLQENTIFNAQSMGRRLSKIALPLVLWSIFYFQYLAYVAGLPYHLVSILQTPAMYHLWFVYMMLGLYLLLPFLQILYKAMQKRFNLQLYFLALWLIIYALPIYVHLPILNLMQMQLFGYGGYFLFGRWLLDITKNNTIPTFWFGMLYLLGVFITFMLTCIFSHQAHQANEQAYLYFSINVCMAALGGFAFCTRLRLSKTITKFIRQLSDKCFLIYFMHVFVLEQVRYNMYVQYFTTQLPVGLSILLMSLIVFSLCVAIAFLIRLVVRNKYVLG